MKMLIFAKRTQLVQTVNPAQGVFHVPGMTTTLGVAHFARFRGNSIEPPIHKHLTFQEAALPVRPNQGWSRLVKANQEARPCQGNVYQGNGKTHFRIIPLTIIPLIVPRLCLLPPRLVAPLRPCVMALNSFWSRLATSASLRLCVKRPLCQSAHSRLFEPVSRAIK